MKWNKTLKTKVEKQLKKLQWEINTDKILELLKPTIGIKTLNTKDKIEIGKSKLGGLPDLPNGIEWPKLNGLYFAFIAQINLKEVKFDIENQLPKEGILYFFFSINQTDYQLEPFDRIHKVLYFNGNLNELRTQIYPNKYNELAKFKETKIDFIEHYTLPSSENYQIIEAKLSDEDENLLFEANEIICQITGANQDIGHQLLGNANAVQGDVCSTWAFQNLNIIGEEIEESKKNEIKKEEKEIVLLLQIDMQDEIPELSKFGASGGIYFGINKKDLKTRNFEDTKFALQNS